MKENNILKLIEKYLNNIASEDETNELLLWYRSKNHDIVELSTTNENEEELAYRRMLSNINSRIEEKEPALLKTRNQLWTKIAAAAAIFIVTSAAVYFYAEKQEMETVPALVFKNDIKPGGNKAILKLGDGSVITLDSNKNGILSSSSGITIKKTAEGLLNYTSNGDKEAQSAAVRYNSITTPKGGQYRIVLSDGTKVWLNAASSITFPTYFANGERRVETSGEVYFEVSKDKQKPFRVVSGEQELVVLGTHFDVNAYGDQQMIRTTLAEGSVNIHRLHSISSATLSPGQQSQLMMGSNERIKVNTADIEEALAWKKELFVFNNTPLAEVMQQIQRWYDVELSYEGSKPSLYFTGVIPRDSNLSALLKVLEGTGGIKFGITGKRVIIRKIK